MPNRLADATSPYLLQHQNNPVDWYPWGSEALDRAKQLDRPIFLSIGYSACHWCHVMEHESFENQAIADLLNEHFVSIKVDREQRPDLDHIYMRAVQMMTGSGGWPMSMFLTPDMKPFYGGTYWPPESRWGRPGFPQVLSAVIDAWRNKRESIEQQGDEMVEHLNADLIQEKPTEANSKLSLENLHSVDAHLQSIFDSKFGGFGSAPKFPHTMDLTLLMHLESRQSNPWRLQVIRTTLDRMFQGGIYDHLGGGFSRYSVDDRWLVPHFEKMLYDNALLASVYLDGYRLTGHASYRQVTQETLDYLLREMRDPLGGFYSAEDADSEGVEGKYYVWSKSELDAILGKERSHVFCQCYDVTAKGNFEGHNILHLDRPLDQLSASLGISVDQLASQLKVDRETLLAVRSQRVRPLLDDKVLVAWNALAIEALAKAGACLGEARYLLAAQQAARFIRRSLCRADGRLMHGWRRGVSEMDGFLDDYAYLANALLTLFEADGNAEWLVWSQQLLEIMRNHFQDPRGGFYYCANDSVALIAKTKDIIDHSVPSGNAMAATAMIRFSQWTGESLWSDLAEQTVAAAETVLRRSPGAAGQMWIALDWIIGPTQQLVFFVPSDSVENQEILTQSWMHYLPRSIRVVASEEASSELQSIAKSLVNQRRSLSTTEPTLYFCQDHECQVPVTGRQAILEVLNRSR